MRDGWVVQRLIREGLTGLPVGSYVGFFTLTELADHRPLGEHSESVSRFLGDLWRLMGKRCEYIGVRELQERGAWHTHLIVPGWVKVDFADVRVLLARHGLGYIFNVTTFRVRPGDRGEGLACYLTKNLGGYLTKATRNDAKWARVVEALPPGRTLVVKSQRWADGLTKEMLRKESRRKLLIQRGMPPYLAASVVAGTYREVEQAGRDLLTSVRVALLEFGIEVDDAVWHPPPPEPAPVLF